MTHKIGRPLRPALALTVVVVLAATTTIWFWPGESDLERHPDLGDGSSLDLVRHVEIRGRSVAAYPYDIQPDVDPFGFTAMSSIPDWEPSAENVRLGLRLPFDWPEKYRELHGQMFNPWTYRTNAIALCRYTRAHGLSEPVEAIASELVDRMLEYTDLVDGARFVIYRFDHSFDGITVPSGWTSAYGNGNVMAGTLALHQCFGEQRYLDAVWELYEALIRFQYQESDSLWTSRVLEDGSVWFEEMPLDSGLQPMVLNGHIYAVWALYDLYEVSGDPEVLELLRAGLTSVAYHGPRYRRPGEVNLYDLRPPDSDDYGPARTIYQQDVLCQISAAQTFQNLRDDFAADMPEAADTLELECELEP
jgi:hypothetical protein